MINPTTSDYARQDMLEAALAYAERGWSVLPLHSIANGRCTCGKSDCKSPGKHPRTEHGEKDATTNQEQIRTWWSRWPKANIGIATGLISGFIALDIDPRNDGHHNLAELEAKHGSLPSTPESQTGGGGRHILLRYPDGTPRWRKALAEGVDIKADGGYIVAPLSNHISGGTYMWDLMFHPDDVPLADVPGWVFDLLEADKHQKQAPPVVGAISEGQRNATLTSLGGSMRRRGLTAEEILPTLVAVNKRRCKPPLQEHDIERIAKSVSRYEPSDRLHQQLTPWEVARNLTCSVSAAKIILAQRKVTR